MYLAHTGLLQKQLLDMLLLHFFSLTWCKKNEQDFSFDFLQNNSNAHSQNQFILWLLSTNPCGGYENMKLERLKTKISRKCI